jgi:hypothetical protein
MALQNITNGWSYSFVANNTSSISVTNIPTNIVNILIVFTNVTVSSSTQNLMVRLSGDNGASYAATGYQSGQNYSTYNSAAWFNQTLSIGLQMGFAVGSGPASSGNLYLYGLNTPFPVTSTGSTFWTSGALFGISGGQLIGSTVNVNAFQIIMGSGNISTGIFKIYGLN